MTASQKIKKLWNTDKRKLSLKEFAQDLLAGSEPDKQTLAKDWFEAKKGKHNKPRADHNKTRINLQRQATKAARRKSKGGSSKPTA